MEKVDELMLAAAALPKVRAAVTTEWKPILAQNGNLGETEAAVRRNSSQRGTTASRHIYARTLDGFNQYVDVGDGRYERRENTP